METASLEAEIARARADPRRAFGHFLVLSELGKGGMGAVYRVWDARLRRLVALKTILPTSEGGKDALERFSREAEAIARLRHPSIVSIHETGDIGGTRFLAMDLIEGSTLDRKLAGKDRLPLTKAIEALRDVARAVHYAHEQGVVHRDLKPQNIIIDASGRAYVLDFGLARVRGSGARVTKTGATLGTPAYMPPEQAGERAAEADERSDVYSLGATLYHVLTGRPPFEGATEYNVIVALHTKDPVPPGALNRRVAGDLDTIAMRCLEKDPARRYPTSGELADELDRYLAGEPIHARPISTVARFLRRARRNKLLTGVVVAALSAVVAAGGFSARALASLSREREQRRQDELDRERQDARTQREEAARQTAQARRQTARLLEDRAARALGEGRFREAAVLAARSIGFGDTPAARATSFLAREGPWRRSTSLPTPATSLYRVVVSPDGSRIAAGTTEGFLVVLDAETGKALLALDSGHKAQIDAMAFSPDGRLLATSSTHGHSIHVRDVASGSVVAKIVAPLARVPLPPRGVAWSPDGARLAVGFGGNATGHLGIFDPATGETIAFLEAAHENWTNAVAWSPDGKEIATSSVDRTLRIWEPTLTKPPRTLVGHENGVNAVAYSPDGLLLASVSHDHTVRIWDAASGRERERERLRGHTEQVGSLAWCPKGSRLASGSMDGTVRIWDLDGGATAVLTAARPVSDVAWSADGKRVVAATGAHDLKVWDAPAGVATVAFRAHRAELAVFAWSPDGRRLATGSFDQTVRIWEAATGKLETTLEHVPTWLTSLAWSPDGKRVAIASNASDPPFQVVELASGRPPFRLEHAALRCAAFGPDGRFLATCGKEGVKLREVGSCAEVAVLQAASEEETRTVAWSPDSKRLLAGSVVFDVERRAELLRLERVGGQPPAAARFDSRGERIAALCQERSIRIFDARTGRAGAEVARHPAKISTFSWSASGRWIAFGGVDGAVRLQAVEPPAGSDGPGEPATLGVHADSLVAVAFAPADDRLACVSRDGVVRILPVDRAISGPDPADLLAEAERETGLSVPDQLLEPVAREETTAPEKRRDPGK
ncbi:protein kinase [bacterium]|nr:protein kinase [bacterium]